MCVCLCVRDTGELCKMAEPIEMPFADDLSGSTVPCTISTGKSTIKRDIVT